MWSRWALQECSFDGGAPYPTPNNIDEQFKGMTYIPWHYTQKSAKRRHFWPIAMFEWMKVICKQKKIQTHFACKLEKGLTKSRTLLDVF